MTTRAVIDVDPAILLWAIDRAGLTFEKISEQIPNLPKWISREKKPTIKQLQSFSRKVYLPFGYLLLNTPPRETLPIPFFRTNIEDRSDKVDINVYDTIILLQQRQDWLRNYLIENDFSKLKFVGSFEVGGTVLDIVKDIRRVLGLREIWASDCDNWEISLGMLTSAIEEVGIITVFNGVVENNTHRPIAVEQCRGFVLVDDFAPFMFVNNSDSKAAQMFTIAHELAHIWTGKSAGFDFRKLQPASDPTEVFCDHIAAEFLVPSEIFKEVWSENPNIKYCSRYFKVSEIVIARKALDTKKISRQAFFEFYNEYIGREFTKKETQSSGGDFYATTKKRLSVTFAAHINNAVQSGDLLYRDAYRLTSLRGDTFQTFFREHI